ncbi:hypothetical protein ES703_36460 [subsurface metagenome]
MKDVPLQVKDIGEGCQFRMKHVKDCFGGKEYELPKSRIKPPRAPRRLSDSAKKKLVERLHGNRVVSTQNLVPVAKSAARKQNKGNSISPHGGKVKNAI